MSKQTKQEIALCIVIYAILGFLFASGRKLLLESALFPNAVLGLMAILNTFDLIKALKADKTNPDAPETLPWSEAKMPLVAFLGSIVYSLVFFKTNYFIATGIMIPVFMLIEKVKPVWKIILITAVYLVFIYVLFVVQLKVQLL
ncbi:MAG: tripartite tricarboxylate transporter TctB family protein [Bulleidia sp.]|nr:tripartite tricarboxylate transporter TctB family protein [Bulleidia sp.]